MTILPVKLEPFLPGKVKSFIFEALDPWMIAPIPFLFLLASSHSFIRRKNCLNCSPICINSAGQDDVGQFFLTNFRKYQAFSVLKEQYKTRE